MSVIEEIRTTHRYRRHAMKQQQSIMLRVSSFVRVNATDWTWPANDEERDRYAKAVESIIDAARKGEGNERVVKLVATADKSRKPFDVMRKETEDKMETLAEDLPAAAWVAGVKGAGMLGLATIVGEAGDLSNYGNVAKLWSRLGFAPYDGLAGSTWKRQSWRPRTLSAEEWIAHPFSGQRYALMAQIATWLVNSQWIGAKKSDTGEGKPNGPYGEIYAARRAKTAEAHPDWTKQHARRDALRITMKEFLKHLWVEWNARAIPEEEQKDAAE